MTSSLSSSSLQSLPPSSPTPHADDLDPILDLITQAKSELSRWQESLDSALGQLATLVQTGQAPKSLAHNNLSITYVSRTTYSFPPDHPITLREASLKQQIKSAFAAEEKRLKEDRELAIALGEATPKDSSHFRFGTL